MSSSRALPILPLAALIAMLAVLGGQALAVQGDTVLVSIDPDPSNGADAGSLAPSISAEGRYIAFESDATDISGDLNGATRDIFVRDLQSGTTELVSASTDGDGASAQSSNPSISADGRYVAFESQAADIPGDVNGVILDVFVRDLQTGTTELVSASTDANGANAGSFNTSISADGRNVAFASFAADIEGDVNGITGDVFVRDLQTGTTQLVSTSTDGDGASNQSSNPSISADGRHIAFTSFADDVPGDVNGAILDVFARDLQTGTTELVSASTDANGADGPSVSPSISAEGRYVAFTSFATDIPGDVNPAVGDVFVRDLQTDTTQLASVSTDGDGADGSSSSPSISANGRYLAFDSFATDIPGNLNGPINDVFVRDLQNGTTRLASVSTDADGVDASSAAASISPDGRFVAFRSNGTDIEGDLNGATVDVFRHTVLPDPPRNLEPPRITGQPVAGQTLSCDPGEWTDGSFIFQWRRGGTPIAGASASTYTLTDADVGHQIDCRVTATNADGSASATSNSTLISNPISGPAGPPGKDAPSDPDPEGPTCAGQPVTILATPGTPTIGTDGDDVILGTEGAEEIFAGAGNDLICLLAGDDFAQGGAGDDRIIGGVGADELRGNQGADTLEGQLGPDTLKGGAGGDTIDGGRGGDTILGQKGNDEIRGGRGEDTLRGNRGHDLIAGERADDTLRGGRGDDELDGGPGRDVCFGGKGENSLSACG